jgi:hypothetical protein
VPSCSIAEIQFWGHNKWEALSSTGIGDISALHPQHHLHKYLQAIRERLMPDGKALWWFQTCETFGAESGQRFAKAWVNFFDCRAAGHTYIIGPFQSGLHLLLFNNSLYPQAFSHHGVAAHAPDF